MSTSWWIDKQIVVYPYNGILFSNKKEWGTATCYHRGELWKHYAKGKKPVTKDNIFMIPFILKMSRIGKSIEKENIFVVG